MTQSQEAGAPAAAGPRLPFTGEEYLASLRDGREIWIYGERVDDVTTHPAFRNSARSLARLYDALYAPSTRALLTVPTDTGNGGFTHPFFKLPYSREDLRAQREAIRAWQELCFGWIGRTPDYKASLLTGLGASPSYHGEYEANARRWYREGQERVLYLGHAIVDPPVDRLLPPEEVADVYVRVERETDNGVVVSGAKVVATGSALSHLIFISHYGTPLHSRELALTFLAPVDLPGVKLLGRASYELSAARAAGPFDYPLSSRLDENDAIVVFDSAEIPWENVLLWDTEKANEFHSHSGWRARAKFMSAVRMTVKLEFLAGLLSKALGIKGTTRARTIKAALGEVLSLRALVAAAADGMIERARPHPGGSLVFDDAYGTAYAAVAPQLYRRVKEIIESTVGSSLIYLSSNAVDFQTPEIRPYLDRYLRGSDGIGALERAKTMKLLWDAIGSEFGGRHELYEVNYLGPPELNFLLSEQLAREDGELERMRQLAERCMEDYDLDGWTAPDLINPDDISPLRG